METQLQTQIHVNKQIKNELRTTNYDDHVGSHVDTNLEWFTKLVILYLFNI